MYSIEQPAVPQVLDDVDHWLVLVSSTSTGANLAQNRLLQLRSTVRPGQLEVCMPEPGEHPAAVQDRVLKRLTLGSGLILLGGDGTFSHAANAIQSDPVLRTLGIPLLAGCVGFGDDIGSTHLGKPAKLNLEHVFKTGKIIDVNPIESSIQSEHGNVTRYGVAYMGLGGSAVGARHFDSHKHRANRLRGTEAGRFLLAAGIVTRTVLEARDYSIVRSDGQERIVSEISFFNYPHMAKYGRAPVEPTDPLLFFSEVGPHSVTKSIRWLGQLASGSIPLARNVIEPPAGKYLPDGQRFCFTVGNKDIPVHWDAEYDVLGAGSKVSIGRSAQPFRAVTTEF